MGYWRPLKYIFYPVVAMPKYRSDQRTLAICLAVMVAVETLLIFTVMHLEHRAAEEDAEERRELRRRAKEIDNLKEEGEAVLEEQSLENELSESLVREKREVAQKRKHNQKIKHGYVIFRTETWLDDRKESVYRKNPKIRNVSLVKKMMEEKAASHDEESWLAEPLPQANKRVFIKVIQDCIVVMDLNYCLLLPHLPLFVFSTMRSLNIFFFNSRLKNINPWQLSDILNFRLSLFCFFFFCF